MHYSFAESFMRKIAILFLLFALSNWLAGCNGQDEGSTAGITTIGNTVAGTVTTSKGTEVPNAEVRLIPADYNPVKDSLAAGFRVEGTNAHGRYAFIDVPPGTYNLEAIHDGTTALVQAIVLDAKSEIKVAPNAVLSLPGSITIMFGKLHFAQGGAFFIPGTTRFIDIDS